MAKIEKKKLKNEAQLFLNEFMEFLQEYKVVGLAIAFIMGNGCNRTDKITS